MKGLTVIALLVSCAAFIAMATEARTSQVEVSHGTYIAVLVEKDFILIGADTGIALACLVGPALADEACEPLAKAIAAHPEIDKGKPIKGAQFWFAAGLYAGAPDTPPTLPHGDRAIAIDKGDDLTVVVFMSEGMACEALQLKGDTRKAFLDVGEGKFNLPGDGT